jgi:hypothetical protein
VTIADIYKYKSGTVGYVYPKVRLDRSALDDANAKNTLR